MRKFVRAKIITNEVVYIWAVGPACLPVCVLITVGPHPAPSANSCEIRFLQETATCENGQEVSSTETHIQSPFFPQSE